MQCRDGIIPAHLTPFLRMGHASLFANLLLRCTHTELPGEPF